jgi:hypothetical protein
MTSQRMWTLAGLDRLASLFESTKCTAINQTRSSVFVINSSLFCFVVCVITDQLIGIHLR